MLYFFSPISLTLYDKTGLYHVHLLVSSITPMQLANFQDRWCVHHATRGHFTFMRFNVLPPAIPTGRP